MLLLKPIFDENDIKELFVSLGYFSSLHGSHKNNFHSLSIIPPSCKILSGHNVWFIVEMQFFSVVLDLRTKITDHNVSEPNSHCDLQSRFFVVCPQFDNSNIQEKRMNVHHESDLKLQIGSC